MKKGSIFVFSAPSGAGKNTLIDYVLENVPGTVYSISATTRPPRPGEADGKNYFFMAEGEFRRRIERGEFAEWAFVHGFYYGTPKSFIDASVKGGRHVVMDIDVAGKKVFDRAYPGAVGILVLPPDMEELGRRLRSRGSDSEETIRVRLENASREIEAAKSEGKYEFTIVNDDLPRAQREAARIVLAVTGARPDAP
ncbi:MAG: guanylate kinase [Chitinispirillaceae bacterium]|nr:guanylate kinase [Chitinispirillaceae bacterium]